MRGVPRVIQRRVRTGHGRPQGLHWRRRLKKSWSCMKLTALTLILFQSLHSKVLCYSPQWWNSLNLTERRHRNASVQVWKCGSFQTNTPVSFVCANVSSRSGSIGRAREKENTVDGHADWFLWTVFLTYFAAFLFLVKLPSSSLVNTVGSCFPPEHLYHFLKQHKNGMEWVLQLMRKTCG